MVRPWYATREEIKGELDVRETARSNWRIDRALLAASEAVEGLCHRRFYPEEGTRFFDWPNAQRAAPWRLWLNDNELISVTSLTTGGFPVADSDFFLRRSDSREEPPFMYVELDLSSNAAFGGGETSQRDIAIAGLFGYRDESTAVGTTAEVLDASESSVDVDGPTSAAVGVGSLLRIDDERLIVTGRTMLDTGQTIQAGVTAQAKDVILTVPSAAGFAVDEVVLVDAERMLIVDIAGTSLIVRRAWDGSTAAAHDAGTAVWAPRSLAVVRGALGTTVSVHSLGAAVSRWDPPGGVRQLTIAEAVTDLLQGRSGYARTAGSGENEREVSGRGLADLRARVYASHGRKARIRAV
ncbi:hypothetical protein [Streptomyces uncialis]|uniref:hypothetical protein n=1 Tax=Streptomyces uncialis TaxID=1048205 RepID=UPI0037A343A5